MSDELRLEMEIDHSYMMSVERTMFEHLRFFIVLLGLLVGVVTATYKYCPEAFLPTTGISGLVFGAVVYSGLLIYLELRIRKIKMLEQIALIRNKFREKEPALASDFILITRIEDCPPYLRTGCSEWYTVVLLCAMCGCSIAWAFYCAWTAYCKWYMGLPDTSLTDIYWSLLGVFEFLAISLVVSGFCFRRAVRYGYYYDLKREFDYGVNVRYTLLEHRGIILPPLLRFARWVEGGIQRSARLGILRKLKEDAGQTLEKDCPFCALVSGENGSSELVEANLSFVLKKDRAPVSKGHLLVIPKRHIVSLSDLSVHEWQELLQTMQRARTIINAEFAPDGYNIGVNEGDAAGQTIRHLHIHIIPRYKGDVESPAGGIRNIIPGKGDYRDS